MAQIPTREQQDEAVARQRSYLEMQVRLIQHELPVGYAHTFQSLQLERGHGYYITPATFAGKRATPKHCFRNSALVAMDGRGAIYVEGHVLVHGVPIVHAWITYDGTTVVDPTLTDDGSTIGYHGIAVKTEALRRILLRKKTWGIFEHDSIDLLLRRDSKTDWLHHFNHGEKNV